MKKKLYLLKNEKGAVAIYVALVGIMLMMFGALAIDYGFLRGVENEIKNADDAGALAGATSLFDEDGNLDYESAISEAKQVTSKNVAGTVNLKDENITVKIGHWSFSDHTFTEVAEGADFNSQKEIIDSNTGLTAYKWQTMSAGDLDKRTDFVNAVEVVSSRNDTPSFFARILGYLNFVVSTRPSTAWLGFTGSVQPNTFNFPFAVCKDSIETDGKYTCNIGRVKNSGNNSTTSESGKWTNLEQLEDGETCSGGTNANELKALLGDSDVCSSLTNQNQIQFGRGIETIKGTVESIFKEEGNDKQATIYRCWENITNKERNWQVTIPVIDCTTGGLCPPVVGAVTVNIIWMINKANGNDYKEAPSKMTVYDEEGNVVTTWQRDGTDEERWKYFVDDFNLVNLNGSTDPSTLYQGTSIYFLPDCQMHEPTGVSGGSKYGIMAKIPVLVQ